MTSATTPTQVETLSELVEDVTTSLTGLFEQMDWAEDEIAQASRRHSIAADLFFHSFLLLKPTHGLMTTEFVYRSHCREILERIATGADTRPGTTAEACLALRDCSMLTPLSSPAAGLYFRMWAAAFPDQPDPGASLRPYHEALERSVIDDLEATTRHKLTVPERKLGTLTCAGLHHGEAVPCRYSTPDPADQATALQLMLPDVSDRAA